MLQVYPRLPPEIWTRVLDYAANSANSTVHDVLAALAIPEYCYEYYNVESIHFEGTNDTDVVKIYLNNKEGTNVHVSELEKVFQALDRFLGNTTSVVISRCKQDDRWLQVLWWLQNMHDLVTVEIIDSDIGDYILDAICSSFCRKLKLVRCTSLSGFKSQVCFVVPEICVASCSPYFANRIAERCFPHGCVGFAWLQILSESTFMARMRNSQSVRKPNPNAHSMSMIHNFKYEFLMSKLSGAFTSLFANLRRYPKVSAKLQFSDHCPKLVRFLSDMTTLDLIAGDEYCTAFEKLFDLVHETNKQRCIATVSFAKHSGKHQLFVNNIPCTTNHADVRQFPIRNPPLIVDGPPQCTHAMARSSQSPPTKRRHTVSESNKFNQKFFANSASSRNGYRSSAALVA